MTILIDKYIKRFPSSSRYGDWHVLFKIQDREEYSNGLLSYVDYKSAKEKYKSLSEVNFTNDAVRGWKIFWNKNPNLYKELKHLFK